MGGSIVLGTYRRVDLALLHAKCITGTSVASLDLDQMNPDLRRCVQILDELPPEIRADLEIEWEGGEADTTPVDDVFTVDDLEDK